LRFIKVSPFLNGLGHIGSNVVLSAGVDTTAFNIATIAAGKNLTVL
jgi:hypothetical protein